MVKSKRLPRFVDSKTTTETQRAGMYKKLAEFDMLNFKYHALHPKDISNDQLADVCSPSIYQNYKLCLTLIFR
jgi:ribonuclease HII